MTPLEKFIQFVIHAHFNFSIWWIVKIFFVISLFLYLAFALIVIRQVNLMSKTLNGEFVKPLKFISFFHFLVAIGIFLLALMIL